MAARITNELNALAEKISGGTLTGAANIADAIHLIAEQYEVYELPEATADQIGGVKLAEHQADSTATDAAGLVTDFNALLAKLVTSGVMATAESEGA